MELKIAIVDDRKEDRERLSLGLNRFFALQRGSQARLSLYPNAEAMLSAFQPGLFQIAFLDIVMDEMNGIELATRLRQADPRLLIVFQTTSREYAFDAFPIHPFDYLMKPCRQEELEGVLTEALRVIEVGDPAISVNSSRGRYDVPLRNIICLASQGHRVELKLAGEQSLLSTETYRDLKEKLCTDPRFLEINRGVLINMDQVLSPQGDGFKMQDGSHLPIRINGRGTVLADFSQYMIARVDRRMV